MSQFANAHFPRRDGTRLWGEWHVPKGAPRGTALVLHGYGDHAGRYREVGSVLAGLGLATMAMDYRGHGRAAGQRGHCSHFDEFLDDLDAGLARVRAAGVSGRRVLLAHSHGSLIALRALADPTRSLGVDCAVLSSPFLGIAVPVSPLKRAAGVVASRMKPAFSMPSGLVVKDLTHDDAILRETEKDTLRHPVATARWYTEALAAHAYVREWAPRIVAPTLWQLAGEDRLVSVAAAREVFARAGGDKQLHVYDGLFHEIYNERERPRVFDDLRAWLAPRVTAPARAA
jgi:alpha-beta hydrolase superfamily lysophospholipase